jgi:steroid 5-alpha reductase family enzyme
MFQLSAFLIALGVLLTACTGVWLASLLKRDVSIVDSLWPMMFLLAAVSYDLTLVDTGPRAAPLLVLVAIWALRLFVYITWRNWGEDEDRRYQQIRANNEPNFELKSLFIVFVLQGVIAWIVSLPLMAAIGAGTAPNALDYLGVGLWALGMLFEAGGDYQLSRFKSDPDNRGKVMDRGLWRYTRHPNYFGNACIWWGFGLIALASGAWWALVSPILMTFLLLKVSGVSLLEKDIGERRPAYADYIARTSAFFPLPPKKVAAASQSANRG